MANNFVKGKHISDTQKFAQGDVIRDRETGTPYFVTHVSKVSTEVVELESREKLLAAKIILERNYGDYVRDLELSCREKKTGGGNSILAWQMATVLYD